MQHHHDDDDDEDEPTLDIMTDFKKNAGIISSPAANGQGGEEAWSFLQESRHASFLEPSLSAVKKNRSCLERSEVMPTEDLSPLLEASANFGLMPPTPGGLADASILGAGPSLDVTAAPPSLNLTEANTAEISR